LRLGDLFNANLSGIREYHCLHQISPLFLMSRSALRGPAILLL
jgi:hypothetical protein